MEVIIQIGLLAIGFVMLIKGADWFVDGAVGVAKKLHIPELVIGLTIVAMGTSAPEAAVSISAALKGSADITIGNIVGSNIMNVWIILGLSAVITPLAVARSTIRYEIPFTVIITILLIVLGLDEAITFTDGIILWALFVVYFIYLFALAKRKGGQQAPALDAKAPSAAGSGARKGAGSKAIPLGKAFLLIIVGVALIVAGSNIAVDAATALARFFGLSERFIGLTIVALGTSLPELVTSVMAARKKSADIAIGNIIGSNIFNILFVVGTSALIVPIPFAPAFIIDTWVAAGAVMMLLVCCVFKQRLGRLSGILMLAAYGAYFAFVCL